MLHPNIHGHFPNIFTDKGWVVGQMFAYDVWMGCKKTKISYLLNMAFRKELLELVLEIIFHFAALVL